MSFDQRAGRGAFSSPRTMPITILCWACVSLAALSAQGAPMYSVTDLGPLSYTSGTSWPVYQLADGQVLNTAGTLAYPFVTTPQASADGYLSQLNAISPGSTFSNLMVNASGYLIGIETYSWSNSDWMTRYSARAFYTKIGADGTLGSLQPLGVNFAPTAPSGRSDPANWWNLRLIGINAKDQVLGTGISSGIPTASVFNVHDGTLTVLATNVQLFNGYNVVDKVLALDDDGRILATGSGGTNGEAPDHLLLLTPEGTSSTPIPVPEPSPLLIMAVGGLVVSLWSRRTRLRTSELPGRFIDCGQDTSRRSAAPRIESSDRRSAG